jgi:hypothetical protein
VLAGLGAMVMLLNRSVELCLDAGDGDCVRVTSNKFPLDVSIGRYPKLENWGKSKLKVFGTSALEVRGMVLVVGRGNELMFDCTLRRFLYALSSVCCRSTCALSSEFS